MHTDMAFQAIINSPFQGYAVKQLKDEAKVNSLCFHHTAKKNDLVYLLIKSNINPSVGVRQN